MKIVCSTLFKFVLGSAYLKCLGVDLEIYLMVLKMVEA